MDQRHTTVLSDLIKEYISTGQPVSSQSLASKSKLNLSSATIRSVMQDLCDSGYIYQPHVSAGRIPTDKGYRYYINKLSEPTLSERQCQQLRTEFHRFVHQYQSLTHALAELLSHNSQLLALVGDTNASQLDQSGVSRILDQAHDDLDVFQEISRILDNLPQHVARIRKEHQTDTTVYVGEENPYYYSSHTSLVLRLADRQPNQPPTILMIIGPKRMRYQRNISLLNEAVDLLK